MSRDGNGDSVSPAGTVPEKPDKGELRHYRVKEEGDVVARLFQWGSEEEGLWIQADESDCENLYAQV
jgi:hypothetical protein